MPDSGEISPTHEGQLPLSDKLSNQAKRATALPALKSSSLVSLGQLCDDDCTVILDKNKLLALKNSEIVLRGSRNYLDGLWDIPIQKSKLQSDNYNSPSLHGFNYESCKSTKIQQNYNIQRTQMKKDNTYFRLFNGLNQLIDVNECDYLCTNQQKIDTRQYSMAKINPKMNVILRKNKTKMDLAAYHHASLFSPVNSTLEFAIGNNHLTSWPGLTRNLVTKHLPPVLATAKGHLNQEKQHLQSTKAPTTYEHEINKIRNNIKRIKKKLPPGKSFTEALKADIFDDAFPISDELNKKTNDVLYKVFETSSATGVTYTDQTGRFPYRSSRGNEYLMVAYHYDANVILVQPIKNRQAATLTSAWKIINDRLTKAGVAPNSYIMDNECSDDLKTALSKAGLTYQLVPPHIHRANKAERAIQTFKCHLKAGLATLDPNFPIHEWDRLIDQCELTLNLLRASRLNPKLSAWAYLFGEFNYMKTPLAPPGTKCLVHLKPNQRGTWAPNGEEGWTVGYCPDHYRCIKVYFPKTRSERNCDTITFFPTVIPYPEVKIDNFLRQAATDIITILTAPPSTTTPSLQAGDVTKNALLDIATILHRAEDLPVATIKDVTTPPQRVDHNQQSTFSEIKDVITPPERVHHKPQSTDSAINKKLRESIPTTRKLDWKKGSNKSTHRYKLRNRDITTPKSYKSRAAQYLLAQHIFSKVNHIYNDSGKKLTIDFLIQGDDGTTKWIPALSNEWGRLAQGNKAGVESTDTIEFIDHLLIPKDSKVTYASFVCDHRPLKDEQWRIRLVVGGDKLSFEADSGSPATDLLETKILFNSVISDARNHGAKFLSMDLKDMFLHTPMEKPEYMKVHIKYFPDDIIQQYALKEITHNGYIYIKIKKGMYGLKQASVLAYQNLTKLLTAGGYQHIVGSLGMWKHNTRKTLFCLCVDDFGVKYYSKADVQHLHDTIAKEYTCKIDWTGENFLGYKLNWNYDKGYVDISIPDYIKTALKRLGHNASINPQYSPHEHIGINWTNKGDRQYAQQPDTSPFLTVKETKYVQQVVGVFLYYARALDSTMLPALNQIGSQQAQPTQLVMKKIQRLMDYANTYQHAYVRFYASDMQLMIDSDAAYLVLPKARSRIAGYFRLANIPTSPFKYKDNGAILIECHTLRDVVTSAAEAETKGVFQNAKLSLPIRHILIAMGHPQLPTPIATDNTTTTGFVHNNMVMKRSKSWDMNLHWLRDKTLQKYFNIHWEKGSGNGGDYFTKHHPTIHHRQQRSRYVRDTLNLLSQNIVSLCKNL